jgi:lipopolysaccharide/colanic/teichoic acid biosynthesis glycosyltransferase
VSQTETSVPAAVEEVDDAPELLVVDDDSPIARLRSSALKRITDVALSSIALLLLSPILLVISVLIAMSCGWPVLFVQRRVGRDGTPFPMLKFRTMRRDAHERREELAHLNVHTGAPIFKVPDDPRVTAVGRVLRRFSLDELPQLVNVLAGDMSLVGPRPPLPEEVSVYSARERMRLLAKPGMTCIWQVSGRSDVDFDTWIEMDLEYLRSWSPMLDAKVMCKTLPAVLRRRGAY